MLRTLVRTKPWLAGVAAAVLLVGAVAGALWFQPWKLFVDETVVEAAPGAPGTPVVTASSPAAPRTTTPPSSPSPSVTAGTPSAAGPRTVARGTLISHEHSTSGTVELVQLADGSHVLRLVDLVTSNGPDLRVWLTDAPVLPGRDGWFVFDDGHHTDLGALKGNRGTQNYPLPAGVDRARHRSVAIWCDRFDVSFGAAELRWV